MGCWFFYSGCKKPFVLVFGPISQNFSTSSLSLTSAHIMPPSMARTNENQITVAPGCKGDEIAPPHFVDGFRGKLRSYVVLLENNTSPLRSTASPRSCLASPFSKVYLSIAIAVHWYSS